MARRARHSCQLCGSPLPPGYDEDGVQFCRPDGRVEAKSLQWLVDNELCDPQEGWLIACEDCVLPPPWGRAPPVGSGSGSSGAGGSSSSLPPPPDALTAPVAASTPAAPAAGIARDGSPAKRAREQTELRASREENQRLVDVFVALSKAAWADESNALGKSRSYKAGAEALARVEEPITLSNCEDYGPGGSRKLAGVGEAIAGKLKEFLETGRVAKLEAYEEILSRKPPSAKKQATKKEKAPVQKTNMLSFFKPKNTG